MDLKDWTIMIYMAGDNNLAVDMAYAMEQIKGVASDSANSPNLFVYYDGNSPSIPTLYCDFSDPHQAKYVRSFKVPKKLYDVPKKQNENAADWRSIVNFVNWCVNDVEVKDANGEISYGRRAKRYALIFSGHSLGFQDIGLFRDESSGKAMKMIDLYLMLEQLTGTKEELEKTATKRGYKDDEFERETTVLLGQKIDILGFDSCVMGMLEVGYQFDYVAKAMIASEGSVPSAGWTYAKILGCLASESTGAACAEDVTGHFVKEFIRSQDAFTVGGVSVDLAAWDLSRMQDLALAFDYLSDVLTACFEVDDRIYRQMERVILKVHWKCQSYMYDQNVDLGDFCELLAAECESVIAELDGAEDTAILEDVISACQNVLDELRRVVILSGFSGGEYQYSNGISVFFPWSWEAYEVSKKNYESLFFAKDVKRGARRFTWSGFLKKYLKDVARRELAPTTPDAAPGERYRYVSGIKFFEPEMASATAGNGDGVRLAGEAGSKLAGEAGSKLAGEAGSKLAGEAGSKLAGEAGSKLAGEAGSKLAGEAGSKLAGEAGSKLAGEAGSKLAGEAGSKLAGEAGSKLAGEAGSKLAGEAGSKLAGEAGSKLAGEAGSKLAGEAGSKLAGEAGSKLAGEAGSKLAGEAGSKLAGEAGSKLAGEAGSKLAGAGGSSAFFYNLRMFKNIESRWNISGFTKRDGPAKEYKDPAAPADPEK